MKGKRKTRKALLPATACKGWNFDSQEKVDPEKLPGRGLDRTAPHVRDAETREGSDREAPATAMFRKPRIEDDALADRKTAFDLTVGAGTKIDGDVAVRGSARILGEVIGSVQVGGELEVELGARIKGRVHAEKAAISGQVEGDVRVRDSLELRTGSHLRGDVYAKSFRIQDGAIFQGQCHMGRQAEGGATSSGAGLRP